MLATCGVAIAQTDNSTVKQRVISFCEQTFNQPNDDNSFYSQDFNRVRAATSKAIDILERKYPGDDISLGWGSHWFPENNDIENPKWRFGSAEVVDDTHANAVVVASDFGKDTDVKLKLVYENGDWRIDNFGVVLLDSEFSINL